MANKSLQMLQFLLFIMPEGMVEIDKWFTVRCNNIFPFLEVEVGGNEMSCNSPNNSNWRRFSLRKGSYLYKRTVLE